MIIGKRKPLADLAAMLKPYTNICLLGCETCVAVSLSGGAKETMETALALSLLLQKEGKEAVITTHTILRQCEYEYIDEFAKMLPALSPEVFLSLGCGVGVQALTARLPEQIFLPGLNTAFMGYPLEQGVWMENCLGCGDCLLDLTMGICPITRCAKSMLNGPCGGAKYGKCEVGDGVDCAWLLIYERLAKVGALEKIEAIQPPKNWSASHHGGPRTIIREDVRLVSATGEQSGKNTQ